MIPCSYLPRDWVKPADSSQRVTTGFNKPSQRILVSCPHPQGAPWAGQSAIELAEGQPSGFRALRLSQG